MRDILIDESRRRTLLQEKLSHHMQACGFCRIETPLFEYYELFSGDISPVDDDSIIKVIDRDGRVVVLRPDMTIPTVRLTATKLRGIQKPLKLFYMGNVYRSDTKERGAQREFCQVGAEIYGCTGKWLDLEILELAKESFREASVSDYKIDIGHVGIIRGIFEGLDLPGDKETRIIGLIGEKNLVELEKEVGSLSIADRDKDIICRLPRFFGKPEDVFGGIDEIAVNDNVRKAVDYLFEVYRKAGEMGLEPNLIVDIGMTGNMKYYTGLIFKAYAHGISNVVISGGRYDDLLGKMDLNTTAAGLAIYMDSMLEAAELEQVRQQKERKILALYNGNRFIEALEHSKDLRRKGITVNLVNMGDLHDTEEYCRQYGYSEIIKFE